MRVLPDIAACGTAEPFGPEDACDLWHAAATYYQLLARATACPTDDAVAALKDGTTYAQMREVLSMLRPELCRMVPSEGTASSELDAAKHDLRKEYTRLFSSPSGACVAPWETLFCDPERSASEYGHAILVRSPEAVDARKRYERAGAAPTTGESPDHMSIECEFAGYLCRMIALEQDEERAQTWAEHLSSFAQIHLQRWFVPFFAQVHESARHPYYEIMGAMGKEVGVIGSAA